jgi:ABC-type nitrate/sulfonate/bicarbonate transport system substrate-binding protein
LWIPFVAKEAKLFEKNGLDVELVLLRGSGQTAQAMVAGSLFASSVALPAVMLADLNGADLVNVAHGIAVQGSKLMVRPQFLKLEDLRGDNVDTPQYIFFSAAGSFHCSCPCSL